MDILNFIGGDFSQPKTNRWLDNVNPATGQVIGRVPDSDSADIQHAVSAAESAFPIWSRLGLAERASHLNRLADWIQNHFDELAQAECDDTGKTLRQARTVDIPRAIANLRFFAAMAMTWGSDSHSTSTDIHYTLRQPLGVVGCISPWNLPLYLFTWKVAPALAAGNCVIGKPSEITPLTAYLMCRGVQECGWPAGVLNVVHGRGATTGEALIGHPAVKAVSFTGGTKTGARIASQLAPRFVKASLELGGKNPNIVFADCDYERMLTTTLRSSFSNQGQICLCGSRILVQCPLLDRFMKDFVKRTSALVVGDPLDEQTDLGAIVSQAHFQKIERCVQIARDEGGSIATGGERVSLNGRCRDGFFMRPAVIGGLPPDCQTNQEEIFGPVVTVQAFDDVEQAVELANATRYGLSASIWTQNTSAGLLCAERVAAGVVWINSWLVRDLRTPFGGIRDSGMGREGGIEAMRFFTEAKSISIRYAGEELRTEGREPIEKT